MKLTTDYKWRRLRRWVTELARQEKGRALSRTMFQSKQYHETRAEVFRAVLIVMDSENRRARSRRKVQP